MSGGWVPDTTRNLGGRFMVMATRVGLDAPVDITQFRGVRTLIPNYTNADPFGDATMQLQFPKITSLDDWNNPELASWLADFSDVDLYWVPGVPSIVGRLAPPGEKLPTFINPLTGQSTAYSPMYTWSQQGESWVQVPTWVKIWEGWFSTFEYSQDGSSDSLTITCQGALFQADRYYAKPYYPPNPQTFESLILGVFDKSKKPHLRTSPAQIVFPDNWTKIAPPSTSFTDPDIYAPNVAPGSPWTGYSQRDTGAWARAVTGFIQQMLSEMIVDGQSGATPGNQWTMLQLPEGNPDFPAGRTPVLLVRDRNRLPDLYLWAGSQDLTLDLTRDTTSVSNIIYGSGTNLDGTDWNNQLISSDGSRVDYLPMAATPDVYPSANNPRFRPGSFVSELYNQYGAGFNQADATTSAQQSLQRDLDSGWAGTITVNIDPSQGMSKWEIRAGMTLCLQGFQGTGAVGMNFHIAQVSASPESGTVELTVDTRYRDLLNLEDAIAGTRDPMTPAKLLLAGQASFILEDAQAQWDYAAGAGYVPKASLQFYNYMTSGNNTYPYATWLKRYPPSKYPSFYVRCNADANTSLGRWAGGIPILTSEKGSIQRAEFFVCDAAGNILALPFHVSLYYVTVTGMAAPFDGTNYSPFQVNAFTKVDPATGAQWPPGYPITGDKSIIRGWGLLGQMAGYSPGQQSAGDQPTGLLTDDSIWTFDATNNPQYNPNLAAGHTEPASGITIYALFYANTTADATENPKAIPAEAVYFGGRLFRQTPAS